MKNENSMEKLYDFLRGVPEKSREEKIKELPKEQLGKLYDFLSGKKGDYEDNQDELSHQGKKG